MNIKEIVETYENLSERQRERIISIATQEIKEQGISGFDSQYKYISRLVDTFQQSYQEKIALRLDAPRREGNEHPLIDSFVYEQNIYEVEDLFMGISLDTVAQLSDRFFNERERELVHKLLDRSNGEGGIPLTQNEIVSGIPIIKIRLETLIRLLEEDERSQQPGRQITYVNLDPDNPWIQWKPRRYNGRPIDFFRKHIDVYGRFVKEGRHALGSFDSSLSVTLRRCKETLGDGMVVRQIELAIPNLKPREGRFLSEGGALAYYRKNIGRYRGLSRFELAKEDVSLAKTLYNTNVKLDDGSIVSQMELAIPERAKKGPIPKRRPYVGEILDAYKRFRGNAARTARELRKTTGLKLYQSQVLGTWKEYGLRGMGRSGYKQRIYSGLDDLILSRVLEECRLKWTGKLP